MDKTATLKRSYPRTEDVKGRNITFRLMTSDDKSPVLKFAKDMPEEDLVHLRWDITQPQAVAEWIENIKANRTSTLLAEEGGKIVGYGSLHHHELTWARHMGELRVMVNPEMRGLGLGRCFVRELVDLARNLGLKRAVVQIASDQPRVRHMFEELGFQAEALLTDWVIDRNDRMCDLIIMSQTLED